MKHMKRIVLLVATAVLSLTAWADEVVFQCNAPAQVIVGKPFQLTYSVNQRARDLQAPPFDGFDLLAGPYSSQSSSTSFINGKRTSSFTLTYTYTLMAQREGSFTIPPASVVVNHNSVSSNGVRITVLPADEQAQPASTGGRQSSDDSRPQQQASGSNINSENIFVRTIVSRTQVCEQEALLLTYKLYFAGVDVTQLTNNTKLPEFKGFLKQDLEQGEIQTQLEHYNGRNYNTAVLYQTVLYPQHSGDIRIEPANFEAVIRVQTRAQVRSIFDDFFGSYTNVTRALTAPAATIHVQPLPAGKPAGFSGAVGQFTMTPSISQTELKANDAVTLKLVIRGNGNMKLIKTPAVDWPEGFEEYDPKVTNDFKTTVNGVSGTKTIEYLVIPRAGGDYTIPPVQFSWFDTDERKYKTLASPEYTIHVQRAAGEENQGQVTNYVGKEAIKQLGTDIRYIYTGPLQAHTARPVLPGNSMWILLLLYLVPALIAALLFIIFRKQIRENADLARVRYKRANKVAQKRLRLAKKLMQEHQDAAFYEEIERAALSYLGDRLAIPTADLSKQNIEGMLRDKGVTEELINEVTDLLSTAEFARYAPTSGQTPDTLYQRTVTLIDKLEDQRI